ncbi:DUF4403 family protein [Acanthopleuribacter pedis]|uniref:DUF4403 family protein n=1 Tax=Acanthopleuribacter pedis TaxID=442870 RepID=A0A8J7U621_9BACT|nr:DUF4403 family protein [Acanthopleuribacter pedis]MBO1321434.1 DUF4403 family protein [Acanthopleuribacter pedis]
MKPSLGVLTASLLLLPAAAQTAPPAQSTIGVRLTLPLATLQAALNEITAEPETGSGSHRVKKRLGPIKASATVRYTYRAERTAPPTVAQLSDTQLRVSMPINITGTVGLKGDAAKVIGLHRKNIDGHLDAHADISVDLEPNLCPRVSVHIHHRWNRGPNFELIDGVTLSVEGVTRNLIEKQKRKLEQKISGLLTCALIRENVQKLWRHHAVPLKTQGETFAYVHIIPRNLHFSGVVIQPDHLGITAALVSETRVGPKPAALPVRPLPRLEKQAYQAGRLALKVPFEISEAALNLAAADLRGKTVTQPVDHLLYQGDAEIKLRDAKLELGRQQLTATLPFAATLPGVLELDGTAVITGTPQLNPVDQRLYLANTAVDLQLGTDGASWLNLFAPLLEAVITPMITEYLNQDLKPNLTKIESAINNLAAENTLGLRIKPLNPVLRLTALELQPKTLHLTATATAELDAELTTLELTPRK